MVFDIKEGKGFPGYLRFRNPRVALNLRHDVKTKTDHLTSKINNSRVSNIKDEHLGIYQKYLRWKVFPGYQRFRRPRISHNLRRDIEAQRMAGDFAPAVQQQREVVTVPGQMWGDICNLFFYEHFEKFFAVLFVSCHKLRIKL